MNDTHTNTPDFPSPEAAEAYKRAQAEIAKARGKPDLWLNGTDGFSALTHLPPEIADLERLGILYLSQTQITDDGLQHIAGMKGLKDLHLSQTQITDDGLRHIAGMGGLEDLYLSHTQITDDGLQHIAGMEGLRTLDLSQTQVTDDGLQHIAGMKGPWNLSLSQTQITDDGLQHIAGMKGLWNLSLSQTQITDDGLRHIAGMEGLGSLYLSYTQITNDGLRHIAGMEGLVNFHLDHTQIGLPGLQHLVWRDGVLRDADGDYGWLYLEGTPALDDDGLRAVYKGMKDASARTKAVLDYARDWVPPVSDAAAVSDVQPDTSPQTRPNFRTQDVKTIFRDHAPDIRMRVQNMVALIQQEEAAHALIPTPNEPDQLDEYNAKTDFLENMRMALSELHGDIPDHPEPELTDDQVRTLKGRMIHLFEALDRARAYLDQDTGTYGGLYKVGLIACVGSLLSVLPTMPSAAAWTVSTGVFAAQTVRLHISKDK